jgi:hypothetical protein
VGSRLEPGLVSIHGWGGWCLDEGGAVGVPLEVMVATRTIPRDFTEIRSTDGLYLRKIQIRNCVILKLEIVFKCTVTNLLMNENESSEQGEEIW